jgi:protein-disulfide isomerase
MGMSGTPAFNINGVVLTGAQPLAEFERLIDQELVHQRN